MRHFVRASLYRSAFSDRQHGDTSSVNPPTGPQRERADTPQRHLVAPGSTDSDANPNAEIVVRDCPIQRMAAEYDSERVDLDDCDAEFDVQNDRWVECDDRVAGPVTLGMLSHEGRAVGADDLAIRPVATTGSRVTSNHLMMFRGGIDNPDEVAAVAMAHNAAGIITEQLLSTTVPQFIVSDADAVAANVQREINGRPDTRLLTIAVTGRAGKSTTALLIAKVLRDAGLSVAYETDLGRHNGRDTQVPGTADGAVGVIQWISEAAEMGSQIAIIEIDAAMASRDIYRGLQIDLVVVAGSADAPGTEDFGPDATTAVLDGIDSDTVVVYPAADKAMRDWVNGQTDAQVLTYGGGDITGPCDVQYDTIDNAGGVMTLLMSRGSDPSGQEMQVLETPLTGRGNAMNVTAATCIGLLLEIPLHSIAESIATVRRLPGRDQRHTDGRVVVTLDAGGDRPRNVAKVRDMHAATGFKPTVVWMVDQEDSHLDLAGHAMLRDAADVIITSCHFQTDNTSDTDSSEPPTNEDAFNRGSNFRAASHLVMDGTDRPKDLRFICDPDAAVRAALRSAGNSDVLVLCGNRGETPVQRRRYLDQTSQLIARVQTEVSEPDAIPGSNRGPLMSDRPSLRVYKA